MKSVHESESSISTEKQTLLQSYSHKYPLLFKWKVATLVIGIISVLLLLGACLLIYYFAIRQTETKDSSFMVNIIQSSSIISTKAQFLTLFSNLYKSNSFIFTYSKMVFPNNNSTLSQSSLKEAFIGSPSNTLFLVQLAEATKITKFGIFVDTSFPIPSDYNNDISYYTFDTKSQSDKQTVMVGISEPYFLKMNSEVPNVGLCEVYRLSNSNINLISLVKIQYDKKVEILLDNSDCFMDKMEKKKFEEEVKKIIGLQDLSNTTINKLQMYHLSN